MKVKRSKNAEYFVSIKLTREEAEILSKLTRYDTNCLLTDLGGKLNMPDNANEVFGFPMHDALYDLGVV